MGCVCYALLCYALQLREGALTHLQGVMEDASACMVSGVCVCYALLCFAMLCFAA